MIRNDPWLSVIHIGPQKAPNPLQPIDVRANWAPRRYGNEFFIVVVEELGVRLEHANVEKDCKGPKRYRQFHVINPQS